MKIFHLPVNTQKDNLRNNSKHSNLGTQCIAKSITFVHNVLYNLCLQCAQ